ncbi:hypothetical protein D3C73_1252990 [compost metagenome]
MINDILSPPFVLFFELTEQVAAHTWMIMPGESARKIQHILINKPVQPAGIPGCGDSLCGQHLPGSLPAIPGVTPGHFIDKTFDIHDLPLQDIE